MWLFELSYRNDTRSSCRTGGYPGITLYISDGHQLGVAKMEPNTRSQSREIVLGPGGVAYGMIAYPDRTTDPAQQNELCHEVAAVRVYAPDSTAAVRRPLKEAGVTCGSARIFSDPLALKSPLSSPSKATATPLADCEFSQLKLKLLNVAGGASHVGLRLVFTNSGGSCDMAGYPGVAGISSAGQQVVQFRRALSGYLGGVKVEQPVVLHHGGSASALIEGEDGQLRGGPRCIRFSRVLITPPNNHRSFEHSLGTLCYPEVHPVVAGQDAGAVAIT